MYFTYSTIRNTKPYPLHIWGILATSQFSSKANTRFRVFYINFSLFLLFMAKILMIQVSIAFFWIPWPLELLETQFQSQIHTEKIKYYKVNEMRESLVNFLFEQSGNFQSSIKKFPQKCRGWGQLPYVHNLFNYQKH